ncbi:hypothetical protein KIPB_012304, partial [Kipferlia bialata]
DTDPLPSTSTDYVDRTAAIDATRITGGKYRQFGPAWVSPGRTLSLEYSLEQNMWLSVFDDPYSDQEWFSGSVDYFECDPVYEDTDATSTYGVDTRTKTFSASSFSSGSTWQSLSMRPYYIGFDCQESWPSGSKAQFEATWRSKVYDFSDGEHIRFNKAFDAS